MSPDLRLGRCRGDTALPSIRSPRDGTYRHREELPESSAINDRPPQARPVSARPLDCCALQATPKSYPDESLDPGTPPPAVGWHPSSVRRHGDFDWSCHV